MALFLWSDITVAKMLEDEIYLGHTISPRYTTPSCKNKKKIARPESEWLRLFIEKLVVGERAEKHSRSAPQEVMIYYRDIGLLDTAEEQTLEQELADTGPAA